MADKANGTTTPTKTPAEGISKKEGVRRALAHLGYEATSAQIQKFLKDEFKIVMSTNHIKNYKSDIRRKARVNSKKIAGKPAHAKPTVAKPVSQKPAVKTPVKAAPHANGKASGLSLNDIRAVKSLTGKLGATKLKGLIDVLSK